MGFESLTFTVTSGHTTAMQKRISIAEFKAQLSTHIGAVRRGSTLTIFDRETPVARLVPYRPQKTALEVWKPIGALAHITLPPAPRGAVDSLAVLLELRQPHR